MKRLSRIKDVRRLSISLTIVAAILYSYSLLQAEFEIGDLGSINSLPISFFVSLSLLTIASAILWVSPQPHGKLLGLQLGLFIIALHLTMLAIGGIGASQTSVASLYSFNGLSEYVFRIGHFNPVPTDLWPLNWPVAYILNAGIMLVLGIDDANFVLTMNIFVWILITTSLVYLFLRTTIGKESVNHCMAGAWLFFVANWLLYYLTSNILGYLLFLLIIVLLAISLLQDRRDMSVAYQLCLILVLVVLPATHLLTALVVCGMLLATYAMRKAKIPILAMALLLVTVIVSWSIYATTDFFEGDLASFVEGLKSAFRLDILLKTGVSDRFIGTEAHQVMNMLKLVSVAVFCAIGFAGGIMALKDKTNARRDNFVLATVIGMLVILFTISVSYELELLQRVYFFAMPAIAYFGVKLLKHRISAIILTIILVVALPLHFITAYSNAVFDYVSMEEISGSYFFHEHTQGGYITGALIAFPLGFIENREQYRFIFLDELQFEGNTLKNRFAGYPHYIYLRQADQAIFDFVGYDQMFHVNDNARLALSNVTLHIDSVTNYHLIYSNPALSIYFAGAP